MEPVSTSEFQAAIGEIRRRGDERHLENVDRLKALEKEFRDHTMSDLNAFNAIRTEIAKNTSITESALVISKDTQKSVEGLVQFMGAASMGRKFLVGFAALLLAAATIWGVVLYIIDKGPLPGPHL